MSHVVTRCSILFTLVLALVGTSDAAQTPVKIAASSGGFTLQVVGGSVWSWGVNSFGQLGDGTLVSHAIAQPVPGLTSVIAVAAGGSHSLALKTDGTVWAWGSNLNGQSGNGTQGIQLSPIQVPGLTGIDAIAAGQNHSLALKSDGTVWAWGNNSNGQVGDNTSGNNKLVPTAVNTNGGLGAVNITAIAAGLNHSLAIKTGGGVWAWGQNNVGQVGDNTAGNNRVVPTSISLTTCTAGAATAIAGGNQHSLAVVGGTVCAWGANANGQLGDNSTTQRNAPVATSTITGIAAVAAGNNFSLGLKGDGTVYAWGNNNNGQLGDTTTTEQLVPVQSVGVIGAAEIAAGAGFGVARLSAPADSLLTWGVEGALGDGIANIRPAPIQISGFPAGVAQASAGGAHTLALLTSGAVWGLGGNASGQLGDNSTTRRLTPVAVSGLTANVTGISAGSAHSLARKLDGSVWAWGNNNNGQLGNNTVTQQTVPVQVVGVGNTGFLTNITGISASGFNNFSLAVDNAGAVYAWGVNANGVLGDNTNVQKLVPVQVLGVGGVGFLSGATAVAAGNTHSLALKGDGTVYAWGSNNNGQLGIGSIDTNQHFTPVLIPNLNGVVAIWAGNQSSFALKADATLWAWGGNGAIPNGVPQSTPSLNQDLTNVHSFAAGNGYALFLIQIGSIKWVGGWGVNNNGQLGNGTIFGISPTFGLGAEEGVSLGFAGKTPRSLSANGHSLAVMTDDSLWGWGFDNNGQLGDSPVIFNATPTAPVARGVPDLTITKTHAAEFTAGSPGTYTITVKNIGLATMNGTITVTDTLPAGMSFVSGAGAGWNCIAAGVGATCANANAGGLAAGASSVITLTVNTTALMFPYQVNLATVSAAGDVHALNNAIGDPASALTPTSIALTPAPTPNPSTFGQSVSLTATVTPSAATGFVVFYDGVSFLGAVAVSGGVANLNTIMLGSGPRLIGALFVPNDSTPYNYSLTPVFTAQTVNTVSSASFTPMASSPLVLGGIHAGYLVAKADFNGDGKLDIAAADSVTQAVTIYLGNGIGGFTASAGGPFATGVSPVAIVATDLNRDGKVDLAIANQGGLNSVTVLLGNGAGAFAAAPGSPFPVGFSPTSLAVAGVNDGRPRVAVAGLASTQIAILRNALGYLFIDTYSLPSGSRSGVAAGDFNGDLTLDLALSDTAGSIGINLKNPDGGYFSQVSIPSTLVNPQGIVTAYLNSDANADLVVWGSAGIEVLLGNGAGAFTEAVGSPFVPGSGSITAISSVSVEDFNGDGIPDLFVVRTPSSTSKGEVVIMLGNGSGRFAQAVGSSYASLSSDLRFAVVGEFNGDGRADVAVTDPANGSVVVLQGTGTAISVGVLRDSAGAIRLGTYASSILSNSGGAFASDPAVAEDLAGKAFVTARDASNAIWTNVYNSGSAIWAGWQSGGGATAGVPSIAVTPNGIAWIAIRDAFNSYWLLSYTSGFGYGTWVPLGGAFAADPVITACGDGSLYIAGKDTFTAMWSGRYIPGTGFQNWVLGGGAISGKASITCGSDNAAYLTARDSFNSNWVVRISGNTWGTWFNGGAQTTIDPKVAALGGSVAIVILGPGGAVWRNTFIQGTGNGWGAWTNVGGSFSDISPAGVSGELFFVAKALNSDLWWWRQTGNQFTWISNNGVAAGALSAAPR